VYLTTFLGSKNMCSFQVRVAVPLTSSFELVNFFSPMQETSTMGSRV